MNKKQPLWQYDWEKKLTTENGFMVQDKQLHLEYIKYLLMQQRDSIKSFCQREIKDSNDWRKVASYIDSIAKEQ